MSPSGSNSGTSACWLSIETLRQVADRLAEDGLPDPSCREVAEALGVEHHVVLAVLASRSEARLRAARATAARARHLGVAELAGARPDDSPA